MFLKVSLLIVGYSVLLIGALILASAVKLLLAVFPEILFAQFLGTVFAILGFLILGKSEKI